MGNDIGPLDPQLGPTKFEKTTNVQIMANFSIPQLQAELLRNAPPTTFILVVGVGMWRTKAHEKKRHKKHGPL